MIGDLVRGCGGHWCRCIRICRLLLNSRFLDWRGSLRKLVTGGRNLHHSRLYRGRCFRRSGCPSTSSQDQHGNDDNKQHEETGSGFHFVLRFEFIFYSALIKGRRRKMKVPKMDG
jgi:hypothetical protein